MKKFTLFSVVFALLIFSFALPCFAENVTAYGSVSNSSQQVSLLLDYVKNLDTYSWMQDFIIIRTGEYSYRLYYCDDLAEDAAYYVDYSRYSTGYNTYQYRFSTGQLSSQLRYDLAGYTAVGNVSGTLHTDDFIGSFYTQLIFILLIVLVILIGFKIFRIRINDGGYDL